MARSSQRKSVTLWNECKLCGAVLSYKDADIHSEKSCPPSTENWLHGYVKDEVLYSKLEECSVDSCKSIPKSECDNVVLLSESALQFCGMVIGDPVCVTSCGMTVVKTLWPSTEKSLISVQMSKQGMEYSFGIAGGAVIVRKLPRPPLAALEIYASCSAFNSVTEDLSSVLQLLYKKRIFSNKDKLSVPYYGKILKFKIEEIVSDTDLSEVNNHTDMDDITNKFPNLHIANNEKDTNSEDCDNRNVKHKKCSVEEIVFYKSMESTKFHITSNVDKNVQGEDLKVKLSDIGGLNEAIQELEELINLAFHSKESHFIGLKPIHGVLLYGPSGTGKTMLANAIANDSKVNVVDIKGAEVYSKYFGETESRLKNLFRDAMKNAPSIIILDEVDALCPNRSSSRTEQEKRVVSTLLTLMDELSWNTKSGNVLAIATSSKPDVIDSSLRRAGRLGREIEIGVPTPIARYDILYKLLQATPHKLTEDDIKSIAQAAHGFVGADLSSLYTHAVSCAVKRAHASKCDPAPTVEVTLEDFSSAITRVKPSAMREALVQVPNVKWSDIGGRHDIKLKLKQAVEWPLTHPESFVRLGITPPRGVLMFGPPGCSKTMIAKALATESNLNFLSIKGPELFSKWVGESERAVRDLFKRARLVAPSIVFFDELDALGAERSSSSQGSASVHERVLAQLLTEIDGVESLDNVIIVGATNRPDRIDKALLRPGRLDRILYVPLPDADTRREIFRLQFVKTPVSNDVNLEDLVIKTEGYSCAEVTAVCHEAALKALEDDINTTQLSIHHFTIALTLVTPHTPASLLKLYDNYVNNCL